MLSHQRCGKVISKIPGAQQAPSKTNLKLTGGNETGTTFSVICFFFAGEPFFIYIYGFSNAFSDDLDGKISNLHRNCIDGVLLRGN